MDKNVRGKETIEELLKHDSAAKIIIISALGREELVLEAAKKGIKDFIQKPFKSDQIIEVMKRNFKEK